MDWLYEFISDNASTIGSIVVGALIVIVLVAWVDRHPKQKQDFQRREPPRDDE